MKCWYAEDKKLQICNQIYFYLKKNKKKYRFTELTYELIKEFNYEVLPNFNLCYMYLNRLDTIVITGVLSGQDVEFYIEYQG